MIPWPHQWNTTSKWVRKVYTYFFLLFNCSTWKFRHYTEVATPIGAALLLRRTVAIVRAELPTDPERTLRTFTFMRDCKKDTKWKEKIIEKGITEAELVTFYLLLFFLLPLSHKKECIMLFEIIWEPVNGSYPNGIVSRVQVHISERILWLRFLKRDNNWRS